MYTFHKQDKIFASDLYGRLQWLAYRLVIVNAHTDLPLIFYLLQVKKPCQEARKKEEGGGGGGVGALSMFHVAVGNL